MDGILNVYKPLGITSFDVIRQLRKILSVKKMGHAGTLDPDAEGVLPVFIGRATKAIQYLADRDKRYRAELTIGTETDTQDASGKIIATSDKEFTKEQVMSAILNFKGKYSQIPPMYSAVKIGGKKLYEFARQGIVIEREPKEVEIYEINLIHIKDNKILFDVVCSKGTYIRTLGTDIAKKMGKCGHISSLVRLKVGNFDIKDSLKIDTILEMAQNMDLDRKLIKVDSIFIDYIKVVLNEQQEKLFKNGSCFNINLYSKQNIFRVYNLENNFIGLGEFIKKEDRFLFKAKKLFI